MSAILDVMRGAVSKDKRRYQKNGFDLDLSYVTPQIIAMGFPSESVEATYRNPMKEVLRFLDLYHKDHYKVYNLCSERGYDAQKFYNRVGLYPFDDHNAPPFELIAAFCQNVQEWLDDDKQNIAVIHCKAGKGRTGLMICAWLLYTRDWRTPEEALDFYAAMRTENKKGVTIPSQIRYVRYFHESLDAPFALRPLLLQRVVFHTLPKTGNTTDINFTVHVGKTLVFTYKQFVEQHKLKDEPKVRRVAESKKRKKSKKDPKRDATHGGVDDKEDAEDGEWSARDLHSSRDTFEEQLLEDEAVFECGGVPVCGDAKIDFERQGNRIFAFWFNTFFVKGLSLVIKKEGLDKGNKDKHHKLYEEAFRVETIFTELTKDAPRNKFTKQSSSAYISSSNLVTTNSSSHIPPYEPILPDLASEPQDTEALDPNQND